MKAETSPETSQIAKQCNTYDLREWGTLKTVYLSFHWVFNDSWTRGFELVTREFEIATRGFKLVTRGLELVTREYDSNSHFWISTRSFKLSTHNS